MPLLSKSLMIRVPSSADLAKQSSLVTTKGDMTLKQAANAVMAWKKGNSVTHSRYN